MITHYLNRRYHKMPNFYNNQSQIDILISQFSNQELSLNEWTHEAHLTVGIWHLLKFSLEEATYLLRSGIIIYNHATGNMNTGSKGYHETITLFWIKVIDSYIKNNQSSNVLSFCNNFLDSSVASKDFAMNFYSKKVLFSPKARAFWVEPDLQALIF